MSLHISTGEFVALMGPSGSGKTTLLNLMGALDQPTQGTISIDGEVLAGKRRSALAHLRLHRLGFVFQAYNLIPVLTAWENAELVLLLQGRTTSHRRERIGTLFHELGLCGLEERKPHQLSGGQQQRVAIARAIAGMPALVLADEPTANLDSTTALALIHTMKTLNAHSGITFVFATHDPQLLLHARRTIRLVDGKVTEDIIHSTT
ncbi:MAG: ABC transporter ATP-binding protein [Myxococcota bacterium]